MEEIYQQVRLSERALQTDKLGYFDLLLFINWFAHNHYLHAEDTPDDFSKRNCCLKSMQI